MANTTLDNITKLQNLAFDPIDNCFNVKIIGGNSGIIKGQVEYYDDLPPADEHTGELWYVQKGSGGVFSLIYYKYPASLYTSDGTNWYQTPLNVKMSEDTLTLNNISDWSEYMNITKDINVGDRLIYNEVSYTNLTGTQTGTPPSTDTTNWRMTDINLTAEPIQLKAISTTDQIITTNVDGIVPLVDEIQESNGITITDGVITFGKSGFYRIQVQLNIDNTNNTEIDTWAEYYDGNNWVVLPDSGNVKDSGNSGIGNFVIETTLTIDTPLIIRLKVRVVSGSATLRYDTADTNVGVPSVTYIAYELDPVIKGITQITNELQEPFIIGKESNGNYSSWDEKGNLRIYGEGVQWDDITSSLIARRLVNTTGSLQYNFDENSITMEDGGNINNNADRLVFNFQKPHKMLPEGEMRLHIHWWQDSTDDIEFTVQYRVQDNNDLKNETWTTVVVSSLTNNVFPYVSGTLNQITDLVAVDLTNYGISATVQFRLTRTDNNNGDIDATFVDAHIPYDSLGSDEEYVKYNN